MERRRIMKKIRSIQFKVFICLFISFMVVFGYVVKNKYDRSFNELLYYSQSSTSDDYINYCTAISNKNGEYKEFDLDKIKQGLSELPKDDSTKIYSMAGSEEQTPTMSTEELVTLIRQVKRLPVERDTLYNEIKNFGKLTATDNYSLN